MSDVRTAHDESPEQRLQALGFRLPRPMQTAGLPFSLARIDGNHVYLAGHVPLDDDGAMARPLGKVGAELTPEQGYRAAQRVALGFFATLQAELGDLDRVAGWLKLFGMVNAAPGFNALPGVINGASELILAVFGPERGAHTRSAVGLAELPFGAPVEIEAELKLKP